jgi:hypothetical protein
VKCANSLDAISLTYRTPYKSVDTAQTIHLPCLRYIRLVDNAMERGSPWYFEASTPNLQAYFDDGDWPTTGLFKIDTSNVIFLQALEAPDLSRFPRLVTLQIFGIDKDLMMAINLLRERPLCSPELAVIKYGKRISDEGLEMAKAALSASAEETGRRVELVLTDWKKDAERKSLWMQEPVRVLANDKRRV